ncbi:MAG TPA: hypothetical protein VNG12_02060 [Acidimicrobiales bacterium]|nr:hypothetical protein [Acidimicrobiales bacterium]
MFGHHRGAGTSQPSDAQVEIHLELDLHEVEETVVAFLENPTDGSRHAMLAELDKLDAQIDLGDAYAASVVDSGIFGQTSKGSVLGETSSHSITEPVPGAVLQAQVALVRAAKNVVRARGADATALTELRAASDSLKALQDQPGDG